MTQSFRVGDTVKRVADFSLFWAENKPNGLFYEITEVKSHKEIKLSGSSLCFCSENFELATTQYPNPPHKHKDLIIAWANGAIMQFRTTGGGWSDVQGNPAWVIGISYRIKPTKSAKDVQIEELEAKAKELLGKITELKESNG